MEAHADKAPVLRRRKKTNLLRAAAAILAIGVVAEAIPWLARDIDAVAERAKMELRGERTHRDDRTFTTAEMDAMQKRTIVAHNGDGILEIIKRANTHNGKTDGIFSDGPALNAEFDYVRSQAIGGVIQRRQPIEVPMIPVVVDRP